MLKAPCHNEAIHSPDTRIQVDMRQWSKHCCGEGTPVRHGADRDGAAARKHDQLPATVHIHTARVKLADIIRDRRRALIKHVHYASRRDAAHDKLRSERHERRPLKRDAILLGRSRHKSEPVIA